MAWFASYVIETFMASLQQLICALWGHEEYLHFEKNRMSLQCVACGHESPGWTVNPRQPVLRFQPKGANTSGQELIRKIA